MRIYSIHTNTTTSRSSQLLLGIPKGKSPGVGIRSQNSGSSFKYEVSTHQILTPNSKKDENFCLSLCPLVFALPFSKLQPNFPTCVFYWIDMSNSIGILKVVVVQGKRLAIRDFKSSDPYVIVKLGNQVAKTKVINSCLNPVWNEEMTFSLTEPVGNLNLEVFDKDRFKADDKMGHAHLNIQPLVSAARLKRVLKVSSEDTTLRKVIPDSDNCLVRESCINSVNGDVVQDVWLRLCDVESGEIELKLKLVNPTPVPSPVK